MLKARESLEDYLIEQFDTIVLYNDKCKNIYNYAHTTYGIPKGLVSDLITKRMQMSEVSEFVLFILLDSLCKTENNPNIKTALSNMLITTAILLTTALDKALFDVFNIIK